MARKQYLGEVTSTSTRFSHPPVQTPGLSRPRPKRQESDDQIDGASYNIRDLAAREVMIRESKPTTEQLAADFEEALRASRAFSWIGVVQSMSQFQLPILDVYLCEVACSEARHNTSVSMTEVVDKFDDLALSLEPYYAASLHLVKEAIVPREELISKVRRMCEDTGRYTLLWEADI